MKNLTAWIFALLISAPAYAGLSSPSYNFHEVVVGHTATVTLSFYNVGVVPVNNITFHWSGDSDHFSYRNINCISVPPAGTCFVEVTFAPEHEGEFFAYLNLMTSAGGTTAYLSGVGLAN